MNKVNERREHAWPTQNSWKRIGEVKEEEEMFIKYDI